MLVGLVLGVRGFQELDPGRPWLSLAYLSVQLVVLQSGEVREPIPIALEIARWLCPLAAACGIVQFLHTGLTVFRTTVETFRSRKLWRRHSIVCIDAGQGATLAMELTRSGSQVCVITADPTGSDLADLRETQALIECGNAEDSTPLLAAGLPHAALLIAATGSDTRNLAIGLTAAQVASARDAGKHGQLTVLAHVADVALRDLIERRGLLGARSNGCALRLFNFNQNFARLSLLRHPLEVLNDGQTRATEVHVLLPALDALGQALALQVARMGHFVNGRKTHLHVLSIAADAAVASLRERFPNLELCCELRAVPIQNSAEYTRAVANLGASLPANAAVNVFTDFDNEQEALTQALQVSEWLIERAGARLMFRCADDSPMRKIIHEQPALRQCVRFLPAFRDACGVEAVVGERLDRLARVVHEEWYREETSRVGACRAKGEAVAEKATFRPWTELSEEQRDANRSQADFIPIKLRALGLLASQSPDSLAAAIAAITPDQMERVAEMEHNRWCAQLWLAGWNHATTRDDTRKLHNDLVPYAQLSEATKKYDRDSIKKLPAYLRSST